MSVKPIFNDPVTQTLFDIQGFVVLPFLDKEEVEMLDKLFDQMHPTLPTEDGFVAGSHSGDFTYKKQASNAIVNVFNKHYERIFQNYHAFGAAFLYKMPNENSNVPIHQDWSIVDENEFVALNCWVPLTDVNETNGTLHVLPGSQYGRVVKTIRSPTMDFFFSGYDELAMQATEPMYVSAGHVVILNQSVVHYSPANRSGKIRKAITAGVKTAGPGMIFHYKAPNAPNGQLEVFEMHEDFLISFDKFNTDIQQRPKFGASIGFKQYEKPTFNDQEILEVFNEMRQKGGYQPIFAIGQLEKPKGIFSLKRLISIFQ